MICTGTGSTGWLKSAKRTTLGDVEACFKQLNRTESVETMN